MKHLGDITAIDGPSTCLWASEIDEFAMAVTKFRFGKDE